MTSKEAIDPKFLNYEFDEEAEGFGEPPSAAEVSGLPARESLPLAQKGALALVALGLLALLLQMSGSAAT